MPQVAIEWKLNLLDFIAATVGMATLSVTIAVWALNTFKRKDDAGDEREDVLQRIDDVKSNLKDDATSLEKRIDKLESKTEDGFKEVFHALSGMRTSLERVSTDAAFIRGRLDKD